MIFFDTIDFTKAVHNNPNLFKKISVELTPINDISHSETAKKFILGYGGEKEMYTAHLEGLSYVEKLAFETMEKLGCKIGHDVYVVGGSTKGLAWLKIRATVLNRCLHVPKVTVPSMGSAMLAASNTLYKNLKDASLGMFQEERVITPYYDFVRKYERLYLEFKDKCSAIFSVDL